MRRLTIDLRFAIAAVLALAAGLGTMALTRPAPSVAALVAGTDLPPGVALRDLDITTRSMSRAPGLLEAGDLESLAGRSLVVGISDGEPLLESMLTSGTVTGAVGLSLAPQHAVQGELVPGDLVDAYVTTDEGTKLLASDIVVVGVTRESGLGGGDVSLVLAANDPLAVEIIGASRTGALDLVRKR